MQEPLVENEVKFDEVDVIGHEGDRQTLPCNGDLDPDSTYIVSSVQHGVYSVRVIVNVFCCYLAFTIVTHHPKRGLMGIVKSIDLGQSVRLAHADQGQTFSLLADFL